MIAVFKSINSKKENQIDEHTKWQNSTLNKKKTKPGTHKTKF
jgi:hypothetical protein